MPQRSWKQGRGRSTDRLTLLFGGGLLMAGFIVFRLFNLQVIEHSVYTALAEDQHSIYQQLTPTRGEIFAHDPLADDGRAPLALNDNTYLLYANPKQITDPGAVVDQLAQLLTFDHDTILARLSKSDDIYEPIEHNLKQEQKDQIDTLAIEGIYFQTEPARYYPEGNIGAHIVGFVGGIDDQRKGQYGIEGYFEKELAGVNGELHIERDASGNWITVGSTHITPAEDGSTVLLTIDRNIQHQVCTRLDAWVQLHGADGGSVIIMNPKTGAVMAMCGAPDFDPNNYSDAASIDRFTNPATYYTYEPGSVFKPLTMAAAIDLGEVTPQTTYVDTGEEKFGSFTIRNYQNKVYGEQTMTQVLDESINTGAIFAARKVGDARFEDYVKQFGFGVPTGIELQSESRGNISSLAQHKDIYTATASFGQGITTTPIQMVAAYGALANGGVLMKPYIVDEVTKSDGTVVKTEPQEIRAVVKPTTAATLAAMLVSVVQNGHGKRAGVPGYFVAGKTGTAQIPSATGVGYDPNRTIGSFAGFAPATDPAFVMLVKIDVPRDVQAAESSAAPLWGDIAAWVLNYLNIPPSAPTN